MYKLYVGNFSSDSGFHIITLNNHFDIISDKSNIASNYNSYLYCDSNNLVLSTVETKGTKNNPNGKIIVFRLDNKDNPNIIITFNSFGLNPCHITYNEEKRIISASNYDSGNLSLFSLDTTDNLSLKQVLTFYKNSLIHCSLFSKDNLHIVDKGASKIYTLNLEEKESLITSIAFKNDVQPRHLINRDNKYFYLISESKPLIITLEYSDNLFKVIDVQRLSNNKCTGCAIKYDKYSEMLYATVRGSNEIKIFSTSQIVPKFIQTIPSFGLNPRDIDISEDLAVVTNLESNCLSLYKKYADGTLGHLNNLSTTSPAFVKIKKC